MALETLATAAVSFLANSLAKTKGVKQAANEMTTAIWEWIRPVFLEEVEDDTELKKLEVQPESAEVKGNVQQVLVQYLQKHPERVLELENLVQQARTGYPERMGDVHNYGTVKKQVNNPNVQGDFNM